MNDEDIDEILRYNYWPCVDIEHNKFIAKLYKYNRRIKKWKQVRNRTFKDPIKAWDYLRETLLKTLKFML